MSVASRLRASIVLDNTGRTVDVPVLVTDEGLLESFVRYIVHNRYKSQSWMIKACQSLALLLDYMSANKNVFSDPRKMFGEFSSALYTGTFSQSGHDPSCLRWTPRRHDDAEKIISHVTMFSDWMAHREGDGKFQLNPWREATNHEKQLNAAAYYQKRDKAFLSHLWSKERANKEISMSRHFTSMLPNKPIVASSEMIKAFPEKYFDRLIDNGFINRGKQASTSLEERLNLKNILITLLMHCGGLRLSETLQLYVDDISSSPQGSCVVEVFHPEVGLSPDGNQRREYLSKIGLKPRNLISKSNSQHCGWKNPLLTNNQNKSFEVFWFPEDAGVVFRSLWVIYLRQRIKDEVSHPYAFYGKTGNPSTTQSYFRSHAIALRKIGLNPSKNGGLSPHGHRHAYGLTLSNHGLDPLFLRLALHHSSIFSSAVYTQPTSSQVRSALKAIDSNTSISLLDKTKQ